MLYSKLSSSLTSENFSKISILLNSLNKMSVELTFENFYLHAAADTPTPAASARSADRLSTVAPTSKNFSKARSLLNLLYNMAIALTFENFYLHAAADTPTPAASSCSADKLSTVAPVLLRSQSLGVEGAGSGSIGGASVGRMRVCGGGGGWVDV